MISALIAAVVLQWIFIVAIGVVLVALLRQVGMLHERLGPVGALTLPGGPAVGDAPPHFDLIALNGRRVRIGDTDRKRTMLLFFLSPSCPVCKSLLPIIKSIAREEGDRLDVVFASDGEPEMQRTMVAEQGLADFPLVLSSSLGLAFQVSKLPHAVLIGDDNRIAAKGLVNNREHLESLFEARKMGVGSLQEYRLAQHNEAALKIGGKDKR